MVISHILHNVKSANLKLLMAWVILLLITLSHETLIAQQPTKKEIEVEAGDEVASATVDGKARWSWNAGGSGELKGTLGGVVSRTINDFK
jgi:hypothetical protein